MNGTHDKHPERVAEWLQKRHKCRRPRWLKKYEKFSIMKVVSGSREDIEVL